MAVNDVTKGHKLSRVRCDGVYGKNVMVFLNDIRWPLQQIAR